MNQYLLSTYARDGEVPGAPSTPIETQMFMERVMALEEAMVADSTFVFGGALLDSHMSTIIRVTDGEAIATDGPTVDSDKQIAGFYIINAEDLDAARDWGGKVAATTNHPIEVRPFRATGRLKM